MAGEIISAIGLIVAALFLMVLGYLITLNPIVGDGAYGTICILTGGLLFLVGVILPFFWPHAHKKEAQSFSIQGKDRCTSSNDSVTTSVAQKPSPAISPSARSIELKVKGISMQLTCGLEAIHILKSLLIQERPKQCSLFDLVEDPNIDKNRLRKALKLLLDLDLIEKVSHETEGVCIIPSNIEAYVAASIKKVCN